MSFAGGAGSHAQWARLTGRCVAQDGETPLHMACSKFEEVTIKALLAAKADTNAKSNVRVGEGAASARGGWRVDCIELLWLGVLNLRLLKDPIRET